MAGTAFRELFGGEGVCAGMASCGWNLVTDLPNPACLTRRST